MGNNIKITVITIVYNGEKYLADTMSSVLNQSFTNLEYLVIDGGSTDGTLDIIAGFKDARLKVISEKDDGISDAFNKGIRIATGDMISLLNADDYYERDALRTMNDNYVDQNTVLCGNVLLHNGKSAVSVKKSSLKGIEKQMSVWHPGMFAPREVYSKVGFYNKAYRVLMDYDFVLRALDLKVNFKFVDTSVAHMRYGGVSNKLIAKSMSEAQEIKDRIFGKRLSHKMQRIYYYVYFKSIISVKNLIYR